MAAQGIVAPFKEGRVHHAAVARDKPGDGNAKPLDPGGVDSGGADQPLKQLQQPFQHIVGIAEARAGRFGDAGDDLHAQVDDHTDQRPRADIDADEIGALGVQRDGDAGAEKKPFGCLEHVFGKTGLCVVAHEPTLARLDLLEETPDEYTREMMLTPWGEAFYYHYRQTCQGLAAIPSGDWRCRFVC